MWKEIDNALIAELKFKDFVQAFDFMNKVAIAAEQENHHPEWSNVYNRVHIKLTTHDAGNQITKKDHQLADRISKIYKSYSSL